MSMSNVYAARSTASQNRSSEPAVAPATSWSVRPLAGNDDVDSTATGPVVRRCDGYRADGVRGRGAVAAHTMGCGAVRYRTRPPGCDRRAGDAGGARGEREPAARG